MKTRITHHARINGICEISKKTGYSRYHIQKCVKGERKASKEFAKILMGVGLDLKPGCTLTVEHGTASLKASNQ